MPSDVIIRRLDIEEDIDALVEMWNASDLQWPSSFTMGVPFDAAFVREWHEEVRSWAIFVAEVGGKIAGYASFMDGQTEGHEGEGYLELLNVDPRFQGKSIGRKLIQATIDLSVEKKQQRQTLHTWSGNFKAVPTYKKTGHFWTPNRGPWMQNFIPGALQMALVKPFFEKHNWYDSYVRELEQTEDDQRWEGHKVYTQHWEADDDALTIWIDREARAPLAVETDNLFVAGMLSDIEPVGDSEITMTWRMTNKGASDVSCWLIAEGDKGLKINHRDVFAVPAGETIERKAPVKVAADAPSSKDDGTAPAVHTTLRIDDQEVELWAGARCKKPLAVDVAPGNLSTTPGVPLTAQVQLHNERAEDTVVALQITLPEGATSDWQRQHVTVPAKSHVSLPITLTGEASAVDDVQLRATMPDTKLDAVTQTMTLYCVGAGGILANSNGSRIETETLRVNVSPEGGSISLSYKDRDRKMLSVSPNVGPPYYSPNEFGKKEFALDVEPIVGGYRVKLDAETRHYKGLWLHQSLDVTAAGTVVLRSWLENRTDKVITKKVHLNFGTFDREVERTALPLPEGIVHTRRSEFPAADADSPRDPREQAEPWLAWEHDGIVAGVAWDESLGRMWQSWSIEMSSSELTVEPGQRSPAMTHLLYVGHGDWRQVRERALRWTGQWVVDPQSTEPLHPETRGIACARVEPALITTLEDSAVAELVVDSVSRCPTDGVVALELASGASASVADVAVSGLAKDAPLKQDVTIEVASQPGVYRGQVQLDLDMMTQTRPFDVVRLGMGGEVSISQSEQAGQPVWEIDNGLTQFALAPEFGPSLMAWTVDGENQLWSAFPEPQGMAYQYPWFGGLHAVAFEPGSWLWHGVLHKGKVSACEVSSTDTHGLVWRGVRMATTVAEDNFRDLAFELDYETVGGSNVLRVTMRAINQRGAVQHARAGLSLAARLGADDPASLMACAPGLRHGAVPWGRSVAGERWAALVNPASGRSIALIGQDNHVGIQHSGQHGRTLVSLPVLRLDAKATVERVYYLALADSFEQASAYACLTAK